MSLVDYWPNQMFLGTSLLTDVNSGNYLHSIDSTERAEGCLPYFKGLAYLIGSLVIVVDFK